LIAQGDCVEALEQVRTAFSEFQAQEAGVGLPWSMCISASAYVRLGQGNEGLATLERAFEVADRNGERHWEAELWRLKGELLLLARPGDRDAAVTCFRRAIDVARRQAARSLELRAATSLARVLLDQRNREPARRMLADVCEPFSEGADTADIRDAHSLLDAMSQSAR
jgi:adenylate cyclase